MSASLANSDGSMRETPPPQGREGEEEGEGGEWETVSLNTLPDEIVLSVFEFLDVPELGALGKTTRRLRTLSTDPLLQKIRLTRAKAALAASLPHRPSLPLLQHTQIYLTRRQHTQRTLSRALLGIRLKQHFANRPSLPALRERGVLFACGGIAPALAGVARLLERERVKDRLRGWVVERPSLEEAVSRGVVCALEEEGGGGAGAGAGAGGVWRREGVRSIARRMGRWGDSDGRGKAKAGTWGRGRVVRYDPPRAMVLGLRRYFEKLAQGAGTGN